MAKCSNQDQPEHARDGEIHHGLKKLQQTRRAGAYACEQENNGTFTTSIQFNITKCINIHAAIVSSSTAKTTA